MYMNLKANGLSKTPAFRSGFEGCGIHSRKAMAPLKQTFRSKGLETGFLYP